MHLDAVLWLWSIPVSLLKSFKLFNRFLDSVWAGVGCFQDFIIFKVSWFPHSTKEATPADGTNVTRVCAEAARGAV